MKMFIPLPLRSSRPGADAHAGRLGSLHRRHEEIAEQIELWNGRVVWVGRGPGEHQTFTRRLTNSIEHHAREAMSEQAHRCWRVDLATNIFLGTSGRADFSTPSFLIYRCLEMPYQDVRAHDVLLVGEVVSAYTLTDIEEVSPGDPLPIDADIPTRNGG